MKKFSFMSMLCAVALTTMSAKADDATTTSSAQFDYASITYTWTDANGDSHESKLTDQATDPYQMSALLNAVYSNPNVPGTVYVPGAVDGSGNKVALPWTTSNKPTEGFTCLLMELTSTATNTPTVGNIDSFKKNVKSIQLIDNVTSCDDSYVLSISGTFDRFYLIGKGKPRLSVSGNWERLSATGNNGGIAGTTDFYQKLMAGSVYNVCHDCGDLPSLKHYYVINPGEGNEPTINNMTMIVPKDRMTYWDEKTEVTVDGVTQTGFVWPNSSGIKRDNSGNYTWYHPEKCPKIAIYQASLTGAVAQASDYDETVQDKRNFTVTLDWTSTLKPNLGWTGGETYEVYVVNDDASETLLTTQEDNLTYAYNVPQYETGYTINYKVVCYPTGSKDNKVGPAITNMVTLPVPGIKDEFIWVYGYRSRFVESDLENSYKNTIKLSPYRLTNEQTTRALWRKKADGTGATKIADLTINTDKTYTVTYNNAMATDATNRYDTEALTTSGSTADAILINDYFLASTTEGGDKAGSYIYYIVDESSAASELTNSTVSIPVFAASVNPQFNTNYDLNVAANDGKHANAVTNTAHVTYSDVTGDTYKSIISYDLYKDHAITYHGTETVDAEIDGNDHNFAGEMTASSIYGNNTYGTNRADIQGASVTARAGQMSWTKNVRNSKGELAAGYTATITLIPTVAQEVAPYVYYYRIWRIEDNSETALNGLSEFSGSVASGSWATTYSHIADVYPEENLESDEKLTVKDIWIGDRFESSKKVNYLIRLYSTNVSKTRYESSKKVPSKKATADVDSASPLCFISECTVSVLYAGDPTDVEEVATTKRVASVRYYNLMGIESAEPFNGVNVMVTTYTDGSCETSKVMR